MKNTPRIFRTRVDDLSPYQISDAWVQLFIGYQIQAGRKETICTATTLLCVFNNITVGNINTFTASIAKYTVYIPLEHPEVSDDIASFL